MSEAAEAEEVPSGFRRTQLGPRTITVPEHWSRVRVKDISEVVTRGKQPTYVDEAGVPVLNQSCIYWDGYYPENLKFLDEDVAADWKPKHFARKGDILINSTGQGTLGRALFWDRESGTHAIDSHITRVSVDSDTVDPEFFRYYLESTWGQTMLYVFCVAGSTGQIELSKTDLLSMPLLSPPVEEQRRIAQILSTVDEQIQQTNAVIENTEKLRFGLMSEFFHTGYNEHQLTERPTFGQIPSDWEIVELAHVADVEMGSSPKSKYYNEDGDGLPFYQANNEFGYRNPTHDRWCSKPNKIADEGDTLVTIRGTYVGQVNVASERCCIGRGLAAVSAREVDQEYLYHHLAHRERYVKSIASGSTFDSINSGELETLSVLVPPQEEQEKIAACLRQLQEKYLKEQEFKKQLKELKRGLMQDLLTGKVRINTDD